MLSQQRLHVHLFTIRLNMFLVLCNRDRAAMLLRCWRFRLFASFHEEFVPQGVGSLYVPYMAIMTVFVWT